VDCQQSTKYHQNIVFNFHQDILASIHRDYPTLTLYGMVSIYPKKNKNKKKPWLTADNKSTLSFDNFQHIALYFSHFASIDIYVSSLDYN
jgi:hypothetical protein